MWQLMEIQKGEHSTIKALSKDGRCEANEFIDNLKQDDEKNHARLWALLDRIAENGPPRNATQFRLVRNNLYEIKANQVRLFCFYDKFTRNLLILTHGMIKGAKKVQNQQIDRAEKIRDEYLSQRRK